MLNYIVDIVYYYFKSKKREFLKNFEIWEFNNEHKHAIIEKNKNNN